MNSPETEEPHTTCKEQGNKGKRDEAVSQLQADQGVRDGSRE